MVNVVAPQTKPELRCREISEDDIGMIADLLTRGFPVRRRDYWMVALARMAGREVPAGYPRFGYMMENNGLAVGAVLQLYAAVELGDGARAIRCNGSSWYVEPGFRSYAALLISRSMRRRDVTYTNLTSAPHTWPTMEVQGFKCYCKGQYVVFPALSPNDRTVNIEEIKENDIFQMYLPEAERALLTEHAQLGCLSLVCHAPDGDFPFVFTPFRIKSGRIHLPCMRLLYCRDMGDFVRFAGPVGRFLLRRRALCVVLDGDRSIAGLRGIPFEQYGRRYFKGPNAPRPGDLAFSELAVFGP
jgi:hypothetical protein